MAVDGGDSDDVELNGLMSREVLHGSFFMRTYMAKDDLYIGQLEQALTNLVMGEHESATSYCNRAQQILVNLRMAGVDYSQVSYITHVVKGLAHHYNLLHRMLKLPQVRKELDEETIASYIIEEECTLAAEGRKDQFLPQANQVFTKKGKSQFQQTSSPSPPTTAQQQQPKHGGGVSEGGEKGKWTKGGQSKGGKEGLQAVAAAVKANPSVVIGFNGAPQEVQGRGTVALLGDGGKRVLVPDVLYVHGVQASLLSAGQLRGSGVQLLDAGDVTLLRAPDGSLLGRAESVKGLDLEKGGKSGMPCVSCVGGKITRHTFPYVGEEEDELLGVVHADLCGPFREAAKDGSRYLLVQKDRKTWYCKTTVKALRTDRGGEFLSHEFMLFLDEKGIIHDLTCPYTPEQNGMAEREMRRIVEAVRTMLLHMGV
ncbi:unnamed protein product [Closterium sp. NIES-53]